jgi:polyhydroxyalkanoate synthesis regulator phasin
MAEQPITLEFLARQFDRVLDRLGTMEDQMTVLTGMVIQLDGRVDGLQAEVRGLSTEVHALHRLLDRLERRVRELEDHTPTVEVAYVSISGEAWQRVHRPLGPVT